MIGDGPELDTLITEENKPRAEETEGLPIGIMMEAGGNVIGTLLNHSPNKFYVHDWKDNVKKEIHRALIRGFVLLLDGGADGRTRRKKKD